MCGKNENTENTNEDPIQNSSVPVTKRRIPLESGLFDEGRAGLTKRPPLGALSFLYDLQNVRPGSLPQLPPKETASTCELVTMPGKVLQDACVDCQAVEATLDIRKRRLCGDCFITYVKSKVLKRMESYRFKNQDKDSRRSLLLPISGGISSLVLLQVLESHMQQQLSKRGRTAYELQVVLVDEDTGMNEPQRVDRTVWYGKLRSQFPSLSFLTVKDLSEVFELDLALEDDLRAFGFTRQEGESDRDLTSRVLSSAASVTAGADVYEILLNRLIMSCAMHNHCESILWGHSDSRLAAKALAGVAKGRGGSLPFEVCDGPSRSGVNYNYPLRDLFKPELRLYASLLPEVFAETVANEAPAQREKTSIRHTSIDDLLTDYINSQGEKYPSIMANVVRTASKLQGPELNGATKSCTICLVPYQDVTQDTFDERHLCYACSRTRRDICGDTLS